MGLGLSDEYCVATVAVLLQLIQVTLPIDPKLIQHSRVGAEYGFQCDGGNTDLLKTDILVYKVELYKNGSGAFRCEHGMPHWQRNVVQDWKIDCEGLEPKTSVKTNQDKFRMSVKVPALKANDETKYMCRVYYLDLLANNDGTDTQESNVLKEILMLYLQEKKGSESCKKGWGYYRKHDKCVKTFLMKETWEEAKVHCQKVHDASLVNILDRDFDDFITSINGLEAHNSIWIGLSQQDGSDTFKWMQGEEMMYSYWAVGYPMDEPGTDCTVKGLIKGGQWSDVQCSERNNFMCEMDASKVVKDDEKPIGPGRYNAIILTFVILTGVVLTIMCILIAIPQHWLWSTQPGEEGDVPEGDTNIDPDDMDDDD